ncbi:MAG: hypothetical protein ABIW79_11025 [Gemmatimonas sp.]
MAADVMEARLERILTRVIDWLKFAEAKNAALVTVDVGAIAGVIGWLASEPGVPLWLAPWLKGSVALLVLSAVVALASFLPVLDVPWLKLRRPLAHGDSVL